MSYITFTPVMLWLHGEKRLFMLGNSKQQADGSKKYGFSTIYQYISRQWKEHFTYALPPKTCIGKILVHAFWQHIMVMRGLYKAYLTFFFFFWEYKSHAVVSSGGEVNADSNLHAWIFSPPIIISWQSVLQWRCVVISSHIFMFVKWQKN